MQRVSSIALAVLGLWFLVAMLSLSDFGHAAVTAWLGAPWNAVLMVLLGITLTYHSSLGVQVVIEDYVHAPLLKVVALLVNKFAHIIVTAAIVFAVLKIAFGTA